MKKKPAILLLAVIMIFTLTSCGNGSGPAASASVPEPSAAESAPSGSVPLTVTAVLERYDEFGNALLSISSEDFLAAGFECGDAVELSFSDGSGMTDIPVYDCYYGDPGDTVVTTYNQDLAIAGVAGSFEQLSGMAAGETVTVTLLEEDRYTELQELYYLPDSKLRYDWQTDENFSNARMVEAGSITPGVLFRGSSPFDPEYGRCELMADFINRNHIQTVIDLADDAESMAGHGELTDTARSLIEHSQVAFAKMAMDNDSPEVCARVGEILREIGSRPAPWLVHCSIGQDRTGFVCCVLEAFCGADYDEIVDDYMETYKNYYGFDETSDPAKYAVMKKRVDYMLCIVTESDAPFELSAEEIQTAAWNYCRGSGLSEDEMQTAYAALCG